MENNWIITAKIHISEADFKLWLASSAKFTTHAELFNCDSDDPFVNILLGGSIKATYGSIAKFFANELSEMILSFDRESLLLYYNNISSTLNFAFEINRYNGFNTAVYNTALLLSITSFKNNDKADFCLISSKEFANICYAIEITKNGIKIIKINSQNAVIPHKYSLIYDMLHKENTLQNYMQKDLYNLFYNFITKRLKTDLEDIILFSSPEHPAVITPDAKYKTDGRHVITDKGEIVPNASPATFTSLGVGYGADNGKVFYGSMEIENADSATFFVLNYGYAKDKSYAYYNGEPICKLSCNFRVFKQGDGYATDNINVYYKGIFLENSNPMAFRLTGDNNFPEAEYLAADNIYTYINGESIEYIDNETVISIGKNFFKDKNNVYYLTTPLDMINPDEARVLNEYYIADKTKAYFCDSKGVVLLENVNTIGLQVRSRLAVDNTHVFFKGSIIEGLDGAKVDIHSDNFSGYLNDGSLVYYYTNKVDADPVTFKALDFGYGSDGKSLFFKGKIVKQGNFQSVISLFDSSITDTSNTFSDDDVIELGNSYKRIKNKIYYSSILLENADADTFKIIYVNTPKGDSATFYAKDKNNVYYKERLIQQADISSFAILLHPDYDTIVDYTPKTAVDSKYAYYKGSIIPDINPATVYPFTIHRAWQAETNIIYKGKVIKNIDLYNFHRIEGDIYTDNKRVYYKILPIENINPSKVVILSNNYIKDDNALCYLEEDWEGYLTANSFMPHINSFDILSENSAFSFDRYKIYFKGQEISDIDLNSINMIGDNYLQDKDNIYCGNIKLENADTAYFMLLGDGYASDGKNTYYQAKQLNTKNMLHVLGSGYATDGTNFWLYGSTLSNPYEHQYITDILGQGFM